MLSEETGSMKYVLTNHKVKMRARIMRGAERTQEATSFRFTASLQQGPAHPTCASTQPAELTVLSEAIQERHSSVITREHASISHSSSASATVALGRKRARQNTIK